jgi:hypothetical protein
MTAAVLDGNKQGEKNRMSNLPTTPGCKVPNRLKAVKNLDKVLDVMEKLEFPSNPTGDDFFNDDHLLGMQCLELSITFLLRSRCVIKPTEKLSLLGKFSSLD